MSRRTGSTDRYHLLRVSKPPPRTTDRTVTMSVLHILRLAVFGHLLSAIFNERVCRDCERPSGSARPVVKTSAC